jgi:hypothetical protein
VPYTNGPTGAVSVVGTAGATFYVTGVQLEVGSVATPYELQIYSDQLTQCQRYYEKGANDGVAPGYAYGAGGCPYGISGPTGSQGITFPFNVRKRAAPTITIYDGAGTSGKFSYYTSSWNNAGSSLTVLSGWQSGFYIQMNQASSIQTNFDYSASAEL